MMNPPSKWSTTVWRPGGAGGWEAWMGGGELAADFGRGELAAEEEEEQEEEEQATPPRPNSSSEAGQWLENGLLEKTDPEGGAWEDQEQAWAAWDCRARLEDGGKEAWGLQEQEDEGRRKRRKVEVALFVGGLTRKAKRELDEEGRAKGESRRG